jgi:hypothetical protein
MAVGQFDKCEVEGPYRTERGSADAKVNLKYSVSPSKYHQPKLSLGSGGYRARSCKATPVNSKLPNNPPGSKSGTYRETKAWLSFQWYLWRLSIRLAQRGKRCARWPAANAVARVAS